MNLSGSNNKHPLNPKKLPSIDQRGCIYSENITLNLPSVDRKWKLMDISVSKAKNTLNPKACQVLDKESTSKSFKPRVENLGTKMSKPAA